MELTFIGYLHLLVGGIIVLAGNLRHALLFLMVSSLFGGSAAALLPALSGSSILPVHFALLFVFLRILAPRGGYLGEVPEALRANLWLALFALYGIASAYIAPRLFAGTMDVWPMRMVGAESHFETRPLEPSSQNITASVYMLGAMLLAMASWIACRRKGGPEMLVSATISVTWIHIAFGVIAMAVRDTPADALLDVFRNSTYIQFDDDISGFIRIRGIFPETSSYCAFGFGFFVANVELWYRAIRSRATGAAALTMAAILCLSTSATAYVALAAYAAFFLLRALFLPGAADPGKIKSAFSAMGFLIFAVAVLMAIVPDFAHAFFDMVMQMTVGKSTSVSGMQRLFWAMQGWQVFLASYGLGIGPGSFRSSSMFLAILGSMGVIGMVCFLVYLGSVFQSWRRSSWGPVDDDIVNLGGAFGSAALLGLIPAALSSANAHPSATFAIFAGCALALRPLGSGRAVGDKPQGEPAVAGL